MRNKMFSISRFALPLILVISTTQSQVWTHAVGFLTASNSISSSKPGADNTVLIAGHNYDSLAIFDTVLTSNGLYDCYIMQLDTNGSMLRYTSFGGTGTDKIFDLDVNDAFDFIVTGVLQKTVTIGDTTFTAPATESFFIAEFSADGIFKWGTVEALSSGNCIRYLKNGAIVVGGQFTDTVVIDGKDTLKSAGNSDIFLSNYANNGTLLRTQRIGGKKSDFISAIDVSPENDIYIAGVFYDTLYIDTVTLIAQSTFEQSYVVKMDSSGNVLWVKSFLSEHTLETTSLTIDENGDCFVTGRFTNNALVDSVTVEADDEYAGFLCKLTPDGDLVWIERYSLVTGNDLILGDNDDLFLAGNFKKKSTFGDITVESHDIEDIFIANITRDGTCNWVRNAGGCRASYGKTITVNNAHLFIGGYADRQLVTRNCPMQFGSEVVDYSNDDQGRSFIAICNHTIENSVFKPYQLTIPTNGIFESAKNYDLKGRDVIRLQNAQNERGHSVTHGVYINRTNGRTFRSLVVD